MQPAASRRLLSTISSRIHPQLPLSPRESQQLLTLLTTSFRAHLDREHPSASASNGPRSSSPTRATSSYASATRHMDSILTNPLFAVKPRRRGSEPAAVDVLRDPTAWFVNEIVTGAADLPKAAMWLDMLEKTTTETSSTPKDGRTPAAILADWLRTSGLDTSKQFLELCTTGLGHGSRFLDRIMTLLLGEGATASPWRWFIRSTEQRAKDTGCDTTKVITFRQQLLAKMVSIEANTGLNRGVAAFMQAFRMAETAGYDSAYSVLKPAGAHLVNRIISNPNQSIEPELYQSFLQSSQHWLGNWNQAVESMLWLHHPIKSNAQPGLRFIQDPTGALSFVQSSRSRRHFLVQLCLGVARQLLEEGKYADAQEAMEFTKEHFADVVLSKTPVVEQQVTASRKARKEKENLELLDRLIPT